MEMTDERYPKVTYITLKYLDDSDKTTRASHIRKLLYTYGFGHVWLQQGVGDIDMFIKQFKSRVNDMGQQNWHSDVSNSPKLVSYAMFKESLNIEDYLKCGMWRRHQVALCKLRTSNHRLAIERLRYIGVEYQQRLCKYCMNIGINVTESEFHFVMVCPLYAQLREQLIGDLIVPSTQHRFIQLMKNTDEQIMKKLGCFIYNRLNIHKGFNGL